MLRGLMIVGAHASYNMGVDLAVLFGATTVLILIASRMYPNLVR